MKMNSATFGRLVSLVGLLACLAGCGDSDLRQPTYPVSGSITFDDKPLADATVVFHAVNKSKFKWQELPQGKTDANGKFTIFTYETGDGAPAAEYNVGIALLEPVAEDGGDQVKHNKNQVKLPLKYTDPIKSGLKAKVDAKATELPPFNLTSK